MIRALLLVALASLASLPVASASTVPATVLLHDLVENGAYVGCHVTSPTFQTFRLTVNRGDRVVLTVEAPTNNTNVHTLSVEGADGGVTKPIAPGERDTLEFTAEGSGSRAVLCDESPGPLQGVLVVRAPAATETNDSPAPAALPALAALAGAALAARRRA